MYMMTNWQDSQLNVKHTCKRELKQTIHISNKTQYLKITKYLIQTKVDFQPSQHKCQLL